MMVSSPPGSPEVVRQRPQSMYGASSPDLSSKSRPQSMMFRPPRNQSRMSQSSKQGISRSSDDDGKTAVKVVVRVRPPLGPSDPGYDLIPQRFQRSMVQVTTPTSLGVDSPPGRKLFIFDRVFGEDVSQKGVWEYLQDSVDSFLQGYNVSILAYGQSGSGKSYTMGTSGPLEQRDVSMKGVVPRAAQHLFDNLETALSSHSRQNSGLKTPTRFSVSSMNQLLQNAKSNTNKGWEMSVTYVEIYNEQPRDLLLSEATPTFERANVQIREDARGRIFVEGLKTVPVNSIEELLAVLNHGSTIRQTDATAINARSSRSHAVFTINLKQSRPQTTTKDKRASVPVEVLTGAEPSMTIESKLHFVDLAGSERLKNTGATGDRAKEGISINAGLASLGKVISQLSTRSSSTYVSYRDSKLTRMLQDSLGGNAITYMIACVTPAEFHLSETLNTVQYAQRARNIQSKPKIQHIQDDADKQAVIDRLRTEVSFLRQQIRSTEGGDRRGGDALERMGRPSEREAELHNQLLDVQESYGTLSHRHAKLISELTNSGDNQVPYVAGESAVDRLKRSQAQQHQIEQMVLEYEKTIQSLEANLSNTRSSLANTESNLMERETKCAYVETMNQQLNSRVQKLMDRESNLEQYLHDLEARLEDESSGGEKNDALMTDLRKEIARIRENETNAEDYICTLEERLAEADQDMEIVQREVERLEHLVERQRSLGKLDNMLYELDHVQRKHRKEGQMIAEKEPLTNGLHKELEPVSEGPEDVELPQGDRDEDFQDAEEKPAGSSTETDAAGLEQLEKATGLSPPRPNHDVDSQQSPAQTRFMAEKFEAVSNELFELRLEHEQTANELDLMSAKYHEALRTLAEMQDSIDEVRHAPRDIDDSRPLSFLEDTRTQDPNNGGRVSSSRSLSSELSLDGESPTTTDTDITPVSKQPGSGEVATKEVERLQSLLAEHERGMTVVTEQYVQLQAEHKDTLTTVEKLKSEIQRNRPASPGSVPAGMFRRMASQTGPNAIDKGQRSITAIRTVLSEELDGQPDKLEGAEVHLSAATHELQNRYDRIQALEAEVKAAKRDMDMKTTIISGLTRERNSMKAGSPVDLSMVSQMRDQLIQKETELKSLHEGYARREQELQDHVQSLSSRQSTPLPILPDEDHEDKIRSLEAQLGNITKQHNSLQQSADESTKQLSVAKSELNAARARMETMQVQQSGAHGDSAFQRAAVGTAMQHERENYEDLVNDLKDALAEQQSTTSSQKSKIYELMELHSSVSRDAQQLSEQLKAREVEITGSHARIKALDREVQEARSAVEFHKHGLKSLHDAHQSGIKREAEFGESQARISVLEQEVQEAKSAVEFHKHGLKSLHEAHRNEVEEMKLSHAGILASYDDQMAEVNAKYEKLQKQKGGGGDAKAVDQLVRDAQAALGHSTTADTLANHIQDMTQENGHVSEALARLNSTNQELERQLAGRQSMAELEEEVKNLSSKINNYQETIRSLANEVGNHEETIRDKDKAIKRHEGTIVSMKEERNKKATLVEELEQQLQNSFDHHHNRISIIEARGNQALVDAQHRITLLEKDLDQRLSYQDSNEGSRTNTMKTHHRPLSPPVEANRSNSLSNLRKSASIASLPSPPPAIPLPPLPTLPGIAATGPTLNPSPPQSRHVSKEVAVPTAPTNNAKDTNVAALRRQSVLIEEQESRLRTVEKHLHAEKQLTATLEEALVDLETQSNKLRADAEGWKKKAWAMEEELGGLRREKKSERLSVQAMEEEVRKRREAEAARAQLEERMRLLNQGEGKKKRKGVGLNCF